MQIVHKANKQWTTSERKLELQLFYKSPSTVQPLEQIGELFQIQHYKNVHMHILQVTYLKNQLQLMSG